MSALPERKASALAVTPRSLRAANCSAALTSRIRALACSSRRWAMIPRSARPPWITKWSSVFAAIPSASSASSHASSKSV